MIDKRSNITDYINEEEELEDKNKIINMPLD